MKMFDIEYVNESLHDIAVEYYSDNPVSEGEFQGFQVGAFYYFIRLQRGELPAVIKNIKVEAMKSFQKTQEKNESGTAISQEVYIGYLKGFAEIFNRFYE